MNAFKIEPFKNPDKTISDTQSVIKLRRHTHHPAVLSEFIKEALPTETIPYERGIYCHVWVLSNKAVEVFKEYLASFSAEQLAEHFAKIRKKFPETPKYVPPPENEETDDDDEDEDGDD